MRFLGRLLPASPALRLVKSSVNTRRCLCWMASQVEGIRLKFPDSAASIAEETERLVASSAKFFDEMAATPLSDVTAKNFAVRISDFEGKFSLPRLSLEFVQHAFGDKALRDASCEADKKISEHEVEIEMRKDLFDRFQAVQRRLREGSETASDEIKRYVDRNVLEGIRNGLNLSEEKRQRIKEIKTEMNRLAIDFEKNLSEDLTFVTVTKEELAGLPDDFVNGLEKDEASGKLKLTMKYPHYFPVMKLATNPETRRRAEFAFNTRCKDANLALLGRLVRLRQERAAILGYASHADYVLEMRMAKNAKTVAEFLSNLSNKLKPLQEKEMAKMLEVKRSDCQKLGREFDGKINPWDSRYLMNKVEEIDYSVDHEKLKEYFPMEKVTRGLLEIYQELLGLKFNLVTDCYKWHEDVSLYSVDDAASNERLGYFYLDLYPRDGKFGHAACFHLQQPCIIEGERQKCVCAVLANFTKPTAEKPSLLTHDEVETFFHEFGHAMHMVCAQAETEKFSGTHVERDFVEAPSQMLENWCWAPESLARMSGHYAKGDAAIPKELLEALINSRKANTGCFNQRQISLGTFDQLIHTTDKKELDLAEEYANVTERIVGVRPSPGTSMPSNFGHLASGYDAQYYGYMWSEVFSADMFVTRFGNKGVMNKESGADYRRCILRPGGSRDAADMLRDFLGREPNQEAFLKMKGL